MIIRYLKLWLKHILMFYKAMMAYKFSFISKAVANLFLDFIGVILAFLLYLNTKGFAGWTLEQFLLLTGTFMFVNGVSHTFFSGMPWNISRGIERGELDKFMTKPINLLLYTTMYSFDDDGMLIMFGGIIVVVYSILNLGIQITLLQLLGYVSLVFFGIILSYSLMIMISSISFVSIKGTGPIADLIFSIAEFSKYPIHVFGNFITFIMTFVLPFGIVAFYPSTVLLNKVVSFWPIIGASLSTFVIFMFSLLVWSKMVKKYQSAGG